MTLLQLQYFVTLARVLHFTRAAEKLHIAQPSLSYSIHELEKELNVRLFEKESRKIILTAHGERFLPYALQALETLEKGRDTLRQMSANELQVVRLGYFQSVAASLIPAFVEGIYSQDGCQSLRFQFEEGSSIEVLDLLRREEIDLGICLHREEWAEAVPVLRQPLYFAAARNHSLARRERVLLTEFLNEPFIMLDRQNGLRMRTDDLFKRHGIIPNIAFEVRECNAALQYVALSYGVAILPRVPAMDSELLSIIPIYDGDAELVRTVYLEWNKHRTLSPAVERVRDYIIENFAIT